MKEIRIKFETTKSMMDYIVSQLSTKFELIFSEKPDYVFFTSGTAHKCFQYDCVRIIIIGENLRPDFNLFDYACGFDKINFGDRYLYYPYYCGVYAKPYMTLALKKHLYSDDYYLKKKKFCNFIVSNGKGADPIREKFFRELNEFKKVDSAGPYLNNMNDEWCVPRGEDIQFREDYKFSLDFENSSYLGYATEKIISGFSGATIPIYWGDPSVNEQFNPKAFVNLHDFKNFDDAIEYIKEIDNSEKLFLEMVKQPILLENSNIPMMLEDSYLINFLSNIFEQSLEDAYRRTNRKIGWGYHYENKYRIGEEMQQDKLINGIYRIKKKLKKKR